MHRDRIGDGLVGSASASGRNAQSEAQAWAHPEASAIPTRAVDERGIERALTEPLPVACRREFARRSGCGFPPEHEEHRRRAGRDWPVVAAVFRGSIWRLASESPRSRTVRGVFVVVVITLAPVTRTLTSLHRIGARVVHDESVHTPIVLGVELGLGGRRRHGACPVGVRVGRRGRRRRRAVRVGVGVRRRSLVGVMVRVAVGVVVGMAVRVAVALAVGCRCDVAFGSTWRTVPRPLPAASKAPMSKLVPCGRERPSRSTGRSVSAIPASIAGWWRAGGNRCGRVDEERRGGRDDRMKVEANDRH